MRQPDEIIKWTEGWLASPMYDYKLVWRFERQSLVLCVGKTCRRGMMYWENDSSERAWGECTRETLESVINSQTVRDAPTR